MGNAALFPSRLLIGLAFAILLPTPVWSQAVKTMTASRVLSNPWDGDGVVGGIVGVSADGAILAASALTDIRIWDLPQGRERTVLRGGHNKPVTVVAFHPRGTWLASGAHDGNIVLWDLTKGEQRAVLEGHQRVISGLKFVGDGSLLVSTSRDGTIRLWDVASGQTRQSWSATQSNMLVSDVTPDQKALITGDGNGVIRSWNFLDATPGPALDGPKAAVTCIVCAPDGHELAVGQREKGVIAFWDLKTNWRRSSFQAHGGTVVDAVFDPAGELLATCGVLDPIIRVWDRAGKPLATLSGHTQYPFKLVFTPDGHFLVSGGCDKTVCLWDLSVLRGGDDPDRKP